MPMHTHNLLQEMRSGKNSALLPLHDITWWTHKTHTLIIGCITLFWRLETGICMFGRFKPSILNSFRLIASRKSGKLFCKTKYVNKMYWLYMQINL